MSESLLQSRNSGQSKTPRRRYSVEFKRALVEESLRPGVSTAKLALQHDLNGNLLHTWRWQYRCGALGPVTSATPSLIPVRVISLTDDVKQSSEHKRVTDSSGMQHEPILDICCGQLQIRFFSDVNPDVLRQVLASLHS